MKVSATLDRDIHIQQPMWHWNPCAGVVGLRLTPKDSAVVVNAEQRWPTLSLWPTLVMRRTCGNKPQGTITLFATLEVATGKVAADACYLCPSHQNFMRLTKG
jgi:hypothetical protein